MIRKNISLKKDDLKKIEPIVDKHEGNLSAAIREVINFADYAINKFGDLESIKKIDGSTKGVVFPKRNLNMASDSDRGLSSRF